MHSSILVVVVALVGLCAAQSTCTLYGADCSCTSNMNYWDSSATCTNGTWTMNPVAAVVVTQGLTFDVGYDRIIFTGDLHITANGSITFGCSFANHTTNETVNIIERNGLVDLRSARMYFYGRLILRFDEADPGAYYSTFIEYDLNSNVSHIENNTVITANFTNGLAACRELSSDLRTAWDGGRVDLNFIILKTDDICNFAKGERIWVRDTMIGAAALMLVLIIFAIITCAVAGIRRRLWYPPDP